MVPVLDLTPLTEGGDISGLARELDEACRKTGFFYVRNHGVPESVLTPCSARTRRYFAIPPKTGEAHVMDEVLPPRLDETGINQHPGFQPDLKESYEDRPSICPRTTLT